MIMTWCSITYTGSSHWYKFEVHIHIVSKIYCTPWSRDVGSCNNIRKLKAVDSLQLPISYLLPCMQLLGTCIVLVNNLQVLFLVEIKRGIAELERSNCNGHFCATCPISFVACSTCPRELPRAQWDLQFLRERETERRVQASCLHWHWRTPYSGNRIQPGQIWC